MRFVRFCQRARERNLVYQTQTSRISIGYGVNESLGMLQNIWMQDVACYPPMVGKPV